MAAKLKFRPIQAIQPLSQETVDKVISEYSLAEAKVIGLLDVDISKGMGVISDREVCFWTRNGHRISFYFLPERDGGGSLAGYVMQPDPWCPGDN